MAHQVPGAQGDGRAGAGAAAGLKGPGWRHTPAESRCCPALTWGLPQRGREGERTQAALQPPTAEYPVTPLYEGGHPDSERPRGLSNVTEQPGGRHSKPPQTWASSAAEQPAPRLGSFLGSFEVTSVILGIMGHKTQSPAHLQGPRCQGAGLWLQGGGKGLSKS